MSTRYSVPTDCEGAETARGARALAAMVLMVLMACVLALGLLAAFVPATDAPVAWSAEAEGAHAPATICGA